MAASIYFQSWSPLRISPLLTVTSRSQLALYLIGTPLCSCERTPAAAGMNCHSDSSAIYSPVDAHQILWSFPFACLYFCFLYFECV